MSSATPARSDRLLKWSETRLRSLDDRLPRSRFGRFGVTHAVIAGADAATSLALAGSLFFDLEPGAAKSKVLQYLLISLAPFVVVAPFIGPLVDRLGHRRRWVVTGTSVVKAMTCLFMARDLQSLWLFPEAFLLLVCGKATAVARSSIVPEIVRTDRELVRANSRLSLIAVFGGAVGLAPAWAIRELFGNQWVLRVACVGFLGAAAVSTRIKMRTRESAETGSGAMPADETSSGPIRRERADNYTEAVRVSGFVMAVLRGVIGLVMFLSLMSLRNAPLWWSGLTLGALSAGTSIGALIADRLRNWARDESTIIVGSAALAGVVAVGCAVVGDRAAGAVLAAVVGLCGSVARLSFDAIVQRDQAVNGQGAAFARFETRFQLSWVLGALLATGLEPPRSVGMLLVGAALAGAFVVGIVGEPALEWLVSKQRAVRNRVPTGRSPRERPPAQLEGGTELTGTTERARQRSAANDSPPDSDPSSESGGRTATVDPTAARSATRLPVMSTTTRRRRDR